MTGKKGAAKNKRNRALWIIWQNHNIAYPDLVRISQLQELDIALLKAKISLAKSIFVDVNSVITKESCLIISNAEDLLNLAIIDQAFLVHHEIVRVILCSMRDIRKALDIEESDLENMSDTALKERVERYRLSVSNSK